MKISVISPVKNEVDFIGYSVMSVLPYVHEILYGVAHSEDGTVELLEHIGAKTEKLKLFSGGTGQPDWNFDPLDIKAYNASFNYLIEQATGDAVWFLHPDMVVTNPEAIQSVSEGPLAWWTTVTSYARSLDTKIVKGRGTQWKHIHAKQFGLHYYGGYGSQNEDFYHSDITGNSYKHYGQEFGEYPYDVADSGIKINHYCELKAYKRRLEKMKLCLRTQHPSAHQRWIDDRAMVHPRVTLESSSNLFGSFEFSKTDQPIPSVFEKYRDEFEPFKRVSKSVDVLSSTR